MASQAFHQHLHLLALEQAHNGRATWPPRKHAQVQAPLRMPIHTHAITHACTAQTMSRRAAMRSFRGMGCPATHLTLAAHHMLPQVAQLLQPHGLDEIVAGAVRDAPQHIGRVAVGGHHCGHKGAAATATQDVGELVSYIGERNGRRKVRFFFTHPRTLCLGQPSRSSRRLTYDGEVQLQPHHLQQLEPVHVCTSNKAMRGMVSGCAGWSAPSHTFRALPPVPTWHVDVRQHQVEILRPLPQQRERRGARYACGHCARRERGAGPPAAAAEAEAWHDAPAGQPGLGATPSLPSTTPPLPPGLHATLPRATRAMLPAAHTCMRAGGGRGSCRSLRVGLSCPTHPCSQLTLVGAPLEHGLDDAQAEGVVVHDEHAESRRE